MEEYFDGLGRKLGEAYEIAKKARLLGLDPELEPEIPRAEDLAARVEKLVGPPGVAEVIRKFEGEELPREELALKVAEMIVDGYFGRFEDAKAAEQAVRTSLTIITEGIATAASIEGITHVKVKKNFDGSPYLALYFAGPIRSAGGTAAALAVLTGDFVRRKLYLDVYKPTELEIERFVEEVDLYSSVVTHLQYTPPAGDVRRAVGNIPVEISGEPTEQITVTGYRGLERIETDRIRGGAVLALAEGVLQKAPKILKHVKKLGIEGWGWLSELSRAPLKEEEEARAYPKGDKYLVDIIAGRPVFGYPGREGGFRLRYGRSRNTGLAAAGVHPAAMKILGDHLAVGTQLKTERPGKGAAVAPVDTIEGPIVKLRDGSVVQVSSVEQAEELKDRVSEVLFLGDILFGFGEFLENNHPLMPAGYCEEWWAQEVGRMSDKWGRTELGPYLDPKYGKPPARLAVEISEKLGVPLHPAYTYHFNDIDLEELKDLGEWLVGGEPEFEDGAMKHLRVKIDQAPKRLLEVLGVPHRVEGDQVVIAEPAHPLCRCLGLVQDGRLTSEKLRATLKAHPAKDVIEIIQMLAEFPVMVKAPTRIGCRMGRPEKTNPRMMKPAPHVLFPIALRGGHTRSIPKAAEKGAVFSEVARCECPKCGEITSRRKCPKCGETTEFTRVCPRCGRPSKTEQCISCDVPTVYFERRQLEVGSLLDEALEKLQEPLPGEIKGVRGMTSTYKIPEPLEKGVLRAKHGVYVFKDGTVRFDATNVPLTHFRPREVGVPVEKLRELGYEKDSEGKPLESEGQLLELRVQDVLLSKPCTEYLLHSAKFVDDLLQKFYGLPPYYNATEPEDLVGHLVIGLAPHTSVGITGRIIGFTDANVGYAHPYFHAAKRRNCLPGDSETYIENPTSLEISSLKRLFWEGKEGRVVDDFGTEARVLGEKHAISFDVESGSQRNGWITRVYRTPAPNHKLKITTRSGRMVEVFPEHRLPTSEGIKRARELKEGDKLFTPEEIDIQEQDIRKLDLLKIFEKNATRDVVVRGIRGFLGKMVQELGGLKETARILKMSKKTFSNYLYRGSVPIQVLKKLLKSTGRHVRDVPSCKLAAKRDTVELKRWLGIDGDFMKVVGYYLAGGYSRKSEEKGGEYYQICFAFKNDEIKKDLEEAIRKSFGVKPSKHAYVLTMSSRLVRELFTRILGLGENTHTKSIPLIFKRLPKEKIASLLAAYFAGDGSVEKGRLHVSVCSVNRDLLKDVSFLLARLGIFSQLKVEERKAKGILLEKYGEERYRGKIFKTYYLSIRSTYAIKFGEKVGFTLSTKQNTLERSYPKERSPRIKKRGSLVEDSVKLIEFKKNEDPYMYDIEVEGAHTFLTSECLLTNNCDGDEDALILLLDGLLNFSKRFLPSTRGGTMDAPLILTTRLDPAEIDDEAYNMDVMPAYPLEFYKATLRFTDPGELVPKIETVKQRLGTDAQCERLEFSHAHDTSDIAAGPAACCYKTLGTMKEKTVAQLSLGRRIRAVDERDVAERLIEHHFIRDLKGNLRAFARQKFRCTNCNMKYRRIPLNGKCNRCGGKLVLTMTRGGVEKYLRVAMRIADEFRVKNYIQQRLGLVQGEINSVFESDARKQLSIADFV